LNSNFHNWPIQIEEDGANEGHKANHSVSSEPICSQKGSLTPSILPSFGPSPFLAKTTFFPETIAQQNSPFPSCLLQLLLLGRPPVPVRATASGIECEEGAILGYSVPTPFESISSPTLP
jgi:hypothetical protein